MDEVPKKILIVDDERQLRDALRDIFTGAEFSVVVAVDGEDGLAKVESFRPDIVLLDIMMPKMDGLEMFQKLRAIPEWRNLPVILLTNLGDMESISGALEQGVTTYLVKTDWKLDDIVDRVRVALDCQ